MQSVLTAVQLLWVNLIMDTFAALALATDPPTSKILDRKPQRKGARLITMNMWKMIIGQAIFQLTVTLILYFAGSEILGYDESRELELNTVIFNTFVWMQIFNEFNNRRLDNKFNIFEGVHRNSFFIVINCIMVGSQIAIVFVGGKAFSITRIDGTQWAICIVLAFLSLPWAVCVRLVPDAWFERVATTVGHPIAVVYRSLGRVMSRVGSFIKGKRRSSATDDTGDLQNPTPEITVTGIGSEKDTVTTYEGDAEKGRIRCCAWIHMDRSMIDHQFAIH